MLTNLIIAFVLALVLILIAVFMKKNKDVFQDWINFLASVIIIAWAIFSMLTYFSIRREVNKVNEIFKSDNTEVVADSVMDTAYIVEDEMITETASDGSCSTISVEELNN